MNVDSDKLTGNELLLMGSAFATLAVSIVYLIYSA